ncbi:hypothetical protein MHLP_01260 [Candidatus Mycoplasma haematolamae str. Purdue]|uniref:Uncharacterized protein n=1 Tax=Mycoplasma haematolamae (strain Purdue) TaxID=1212765 RepID=I7C5P2_MYCHA|nr:hypothetical protein [Candidatus Mycoplasma haematolamae]AFO51832.1 hypothetical protein MHLP_01260 [Candidatus Mycoplasma haematolamae str. Purdue]
MTFYKIVMGITGLLVAGGIGSVIFESNRKGADLNDQSNPKGSLGNASLGVSGLQTDPIEGENSKETGTHRLTFVKQGGKEEFAWLKCTDDQVPVLEESKGKLTIKCGNKTAYNSNSLQLNSEDKNPKRIGCEDESSEGKQFTCNSESNSLYSVKKEGSEIVVEWG